MPMPNNSLPDSAKIPATVDESIILSFGSNMGDGAANIKTALDLLKKNDVFAHNVSSFYKTSPLGNTHQQDFINAAAAVTTNASPARLLEICKNIAGAKESLT